MFVVDEPAAAAIHKAYFESGELSAVVELRRHFLGIVDNENARSCVRTIATVFHRRALSNCKRVGQGPARDARRSCHAGSG
jgi:hypothetical protein